MGSRSIRADSHFGPPQSLLQRPGPESRHPGGADKPVITGAGVAAEPTETLSTLRCPNIRRAHMLPSRCTHWDAIATVAAVPVCVQFHAVGGNICGKNVSMRVNFIQFGYGVNFRSDTLQIRPSSFDQRNRIGWATPLPPHRWHFRSNSPDHQCRIGKPIPLHAHGSRNDGTISHQRLIHKVESIGPQM